MVGAEGIPSGAVKCTEIRKNTSGESALLGHNWHWEMKVEGAKRIRYIHFFNFWKKKGVLFENLNMFSIFWKQVFKKFPTNSWNFVLIKFTTNIEQKIMKEFCLQYNKQNPAETKSQYFIYIIWFDCWIHQLKSSMPQFLYEIEQFEKQFGEMI